MGIGMSQVWVAKVLGNDKEMSVNSANLGKIMMRKNLGQPCLTPWICINFSTDSLFNVEKNYEINTIEIWRE